MTHSHTMTAVSPDDMLSDDWFKKFSEERSTLQERHQERCQYRLEKYDSNIDYDEVDLTDLGYDYAMFEELLPVDISPDHFHLMLMGANRAWEDMASDTSWLIDIASEPF